jgi:peptide/nickel transport system substrate-binding protein
MPTPRINAFPGLAVLAIALLLAGCGGSNSGGPSSSTAAGPPVSGGSIVYGADREPTCLDPHNLGDMPQTYVARQYLDSLVSEERDGTVVPWLADSWTVSPDGLTYTFKIKQGVKFHDGTPLDAAAVKANFEHMLDPATPSLTDAGYLKPYYKSSRAVDPSTFELSLSTPYSALLQVLSQAFFGIQSPKALARGLDANCQSPVGTGPFIVKQWVHGQSVELDRKPNYNSAPAEAKHQGPAYLDHISWKFLEDGSVRFAAVAGQGADLIFNPPLQNAALKSDPNLVLQDFTHTGLPNGIALNTTRFPFDDVAVRQAFIRGSNAEAAVKSAYLGVFNWEPGPVSSTTPFFKIDLRLALGQRGDDVPRHPALGDVVEAGENTCQLVGVKIGGGLGDRDAQLRGHRADAGRDDRRVQHRRGLGAAAQRLGDVVAEPRRAASRSAKNRKSNFPRSRIRPMRW